MNAERIIAGTKLVTQWIENHPNVRVHSVSVTDFDQPQILIAMDSFRELFRGQQVKRRVNGDTAHYRIASDGVEVRGVEASSVAEHGVEL